jgi:hypothetical protein
MSYNPTTDFVALIRATGGGAQTEQIPGLDFVVSALKRVGLLNNLVIGATAPTTNQAQTPWFQPASPSWSGEGIFFLWNAAANTYQPATLALWAAFLVPIVSGYSFQSTAISGVAIAAGTSLFAVQRAAPAATALTLPNLTAQFASGKKLQIVDFSTGVVNHTITLSVPDTATIMQLANWQLLSTGVQLAGVMLQPCPDLNSWIIAP